MTETTATTEMRLAELQRSVDVGNATIGGQLALLVQRGDQSDRAMAEVRASVEKANVRVDKLDERADGQDKRMGDQDSRIARAFGIAVGASVVLPTASGFVLWALSHH